MRSKQFGPSVRWGLAVSAITLILASSAWAANEEKVLYTFTGGNDGGDTGAPREWQMDRNRSVQLPGGQRRQEPLWRCHEGCQGEPLRYDRCRRQRRSLQRRRLRHGFQTDAFRQGLERERAVQLRRGQGRVWSRRWRGLRP